MQYAYDEFMHIIHTDIYTHMHAHAHTHTHTHTIQHNTVQHTATLNQCRQTLLVPYRRTGNGVGSHSLDYLSET